MHEPAPSMLVTDAERVAEIAREIAEAGSFALDLEFRSEHRYVPDLALVQVAWGMLQYNERGKAVFERLCKGQKTRRKQAAVALARKVLVKHLQSGNSYGIQLKETHAKFPQPELGPWVEGSKTVGTDWKPTVLEGWEPPEGH